MTHVGYVGVEVRQDVILERLGPGLYDWREPEVLKVRRGTALADCLRGIRLTAEG